MKKNLCNFYCYKNTREKNTFKPKKLDKLEMVIFDMDGVLTDIISSWKYIHDFFKTSNQRSVDNYLKGKIDDMEFIKRDVSLWIENGKLITQDRLNQILSDVPLMKGADECIKIISQNNIKTAIVSAGLDLLANKTAKELGIDYVKSNGIKTDENGRLTGEGILNVRLMYKDLAVKSLLSDLKIPLERVASVGNSCFDIPMLEITGLSVAFNPSDDCTIEAADYVVKEKDLSKILPVFDSYLN
ncbi:MAG: HAD-IB family phosphatase [Thermoplasmatales archaeon]|nr:MAG: HAD-IB family phosphatase [Thermoplasmatales archaeon]